MVQVIGLKLFCTYLILLILKRVVVSVFWKAKMATPVLKESNPT